MKTIYSTILFTLLFARYTKAASGDNYFSSSAQLTSVLLLILLIISLLIYVAYSYMKYKKTEDNLNTEKPPTVHTIIDGLNKNQLNDLLKLKKRKSTIQTTETKNEKEQNKSTFILIGFLLSSFLANAQGARAGSTIGEPGIIITILLLFLPILLATALIINRATSALKKYSNAKKIKSAEILSNEIKAIESGTIIENLETRKTAIEYQLTNTELSGDETPSDAKGIVNNVSSKQEVHFTALKKKAAPRPSLNADISKLVLWYLGCAAFWLVIGTAIGEYVGIKFVVPDADHVSWLSFGRLRPVHTNIVFWGWASLGILGLGFYVVPTVSNTKLYSIKWGWIALILTNLQVIFGSISLMAGINNGGGEFREYIWPIMALFAVALILTFFNFLKTVAQRTTKEIYISNWYIVSAILFTIIVASTAYLPFWQNGLGETIIQGYYMHSGVGMWFTLFTLGLLYYFIPQQINKPIYAYSLGILAFWTQILFYTVIGTHHFVFSAVPWWLQTIGIVGSAGMFIPVVAATINFGMTFKGQWDKVSSSYTLPFFLTAAVYYFVVSMQGTAEAFRFTNLLWHFTDFTVAHSHLGFYGIITFAIWGGTYAIVPRLTGKEPPQHLVGAHFWLAFVGLLMYSIPLMIGGTLKGLIWMNHQPFIDGVVMMFDYWIWRAIGGSLMFLSHLIYFFNFYKMSYVSKEEIDITEETFKHLQKEISSTTK